MAGLVTKLFLSVFIHIYLVLGALKNEKLMIKVDRMEVCYLSPDAPIHFNYFILKYTKDVGYSVDVDIDILRDVASEKLWGLLRVERCANREALDTCEPFTVLKPPTHICNFLEMKAMGIGSILASFNPPPKCPFRKGKLVGKNVTFNPDLFTMLPITKFYWKVHGEGGEGDRHYYTICFEGSVLPNRDQSSYNITAN